MSSPNGQTPPPTYDQAVGLNIATIQVDQMQPQQELAAYQPSVYLPTTTYQPQVYIPTYTLQLHLPSYPPEQHQATDPQNLQLTTRTCQPVQYVTHMGWLPPQQPALEQQDHHLQRRTRQRHRQPQDEGQSSLWWYIGGFVFAVILIIVVLNFFVFRRFPGGID
eukprot:GFUD01066226.1.p1 GENE.GFUD01066226.1~~GFUD01066226.1.p1  ORF type:complete len:164 (+),score=18.51 GFUD01066226.1:128-619(+)